MECLSLGLSEKSRDRTERTAGMALVNLSAVGNSVLESETKFISKNMNVFSYQRSS